MDHKISRTWQTKDADSRMACWLSGSAGGMALPELIEFLRARGVPLDEVRINFNTVSWPEDPTEAERTARAHSTRNHADRHEAWKRRMWEQLKEEFGD